MNVVKSVSYEPKLEYVFSLSRLNDNQVSSLMLIKTTEMRKSMQINISIIDVLSRYIITNKWLRSLNSFKADDSVLFVNKLAQDSDGLEILFMKVYSEFLDLTPHDFVAVFFASWISMDHFSMLIY